MTYTNKPLSHIKVLDISRVLAGPWATQLLADLGAEVLKVEQPQGGDCTRQWGPPYDQHGFSAYFLSANRGKKSLTLDFKSQKDLDVLDQLIRESDIFVENFLPDKLKKFHLDWPTLKMINPRLIYCSITGFSSTSSYAQRPGYDYMIQAMGGLMSITGLPDQESGGQPMRVGIPVVDLFTGMYAANGIQAALIQREKTGLGSLVEVALMDVQYAMLSNQAMNFLVSGECPQRLGNGHPNIVPYQLFKTKDKPIIIAVGNDGQFHRLCEILNMPALADDPSYSTNDHRVANRRTLITLIEEKTLEMTSQQLMTGLELHDIPYSIVNDIAHAFGLDYAKEQNILKKLYHEQGTSWTIKNPIHLNGMDMTSEIHPPK